MWPQVQNTPEVMCQFWERVHPAPASMGVDIHVPGHSNSAKILHNTPVGVEVHRLQWCNGKCRTHWRRCVNSKTLYTLLWPAGGWRSDIPVPQQFYTMLRRAWEWQIHILFHWQCCCSKCGTCQSEYFSGSHHCTLLQVNGDNSICGTYWSSYLNSENKLHCTLVDLWLCLDARNQIHELQWLTRTWYCVVYYWGCNAQNQLVWLQWPTRAWYHVL